MKVVENDRYEGDVLGGKLMRYLWYNRVNYNESVAYYENSFISREKLAEITEQFPTPSIYMTRRGFEKERVPRMRPFLGIQVLKSILLSRLPQILLF